MNSKLERWKNWINEKLSQKKITRSIENVQESDKPILFILHDITAAGAQLFLVRLIEWITHSEPKIHKEVLINICRKNIPDYGKQGKFVLEQIEKYCKIHFIDVFTGLPENVDDIRSNFYSLIYVNTSVLGNLLDSIGKIPSPIIVHVHELKFWINHRLGIEKFNLLFKYNPHWIACSNAVKDNLVDFCLVPHQKIDVIHSFIPTDKLLELPEKTSQEVRHDLNIAKDSFIIACCGTLDWRKGGDLILPLLVILKQKLPPQVNFICIWVGNWMNQFAEAEMKYVLQKAGLENNIIFTGHQNYPINYMNCADIFLLLSREDPFPLVMLEAAVCKLPVIGFEGSGGVSEFVETDSGLLSPYLNLEVMAEKIAMLYSNPQLRKKMGENAYKKVNQLYSEAVLAPKIIKLIQSVMLDNEKIVLSAINYNIPKVSIIVPNYNHAPYLHKRLDSIYNQTYRDFEVILLDDCSTDESKTILASYAEKPNTIFVANESNSGSVFKQWQKGVSLSHGNYIWIAESDDFASSDFLEKLVELLDQNPEVGLAYSQSWLVNSQDTVIGDGRCWTDDLDNERWSNGFINNGRDEINQFLLYKNTIPNASAVLIRRSALDISGGIIDEPFRLCGDWLQWIKILSVSDIAFVPECLNYWRQNTSNARVKSAGTLEWAEGEKVLNYACDILNLPPEQKSHILLTFLRKCWEWQKDFIQSKIFTSI
jgi:glycosyltransferase involved in cell wall biosynthesis